MKELRFPLLTKDDIELRIGQMSKDGTKASLLLYQDARCAMKYLDQVVGPTNWQKRYYEVRGLVICSIGINIYFDELTREPQFIWKDDTGSSGSIEEEKSIISDSTKRAAVAWGLARELYTAPDIWVKIESKYDKFKVASISYNEDREIKTLEIANKNNEIVYSYGLNKKVSQVVNKVAQTRQYEKGTVEEITKGLGDTFDLDNVDDDGVMCSAETKSKIQEITGHFSSERYTKFKAYMKENFGCESIAELTESQGQKLLKVLGGK